jgi:hypothetical protein
MLYNAAQTYAHGQDRQTEGRDWFTRGVPGEFSVAASPVQGTSQSQLETYRATFQRYCLTCHTQRLKAQGTVPVALDTVNLANVAANADVWKKLS